MKWLLRTCAPMFHDCLYYFIRAQMKVVAVVSETELKRFPAPVQYTICPRLLTHRFWTFLIGCCVRVPHHIFICGLRVTRHPVGLRRRGRAQLGRRVKCPSGDNTRIGSRAPLACARVANVVRRVRVAVVTPEGFVEVLGLDLKIFTASLRLKNCPRQSIHGFGHDLLLFECRTTMTGGL